MHNTLMARTSPAMTSSLESGSYSDLLKPIRSFPLILNGQA